MKHIIRAGKYFGKPAYWTGEGWSRDPREAREYDREEGSEVLKKMMDAGFKTVQLLEQIEKENK